MKDKLLWECGIIISIILRVIRMLVMDNTAYSTAFKIFEILFILSYSIVGVVIIIKKKRFDTIKEWLNFGVSWFLFFYFLFVFSL